MTVKLNETEIRLDFSFVFVSTLMLVLCDEKIVLISIFSSVLHEFGHLAAMSFCGERAQKVVFGAFGVRIEKYSFSGVSYKKEAVIALGGIAVNFLLCMVFLMCSSFYKSYFFLCTAIVNIFIALMNMIPIGALDMGRALKYLLLTKKSDSEVQKITGIVSVVFCCVFLGFTVFYSVCVKVNISLIAVTVYLCLSFKELK